MATNKLTDAAIRRMKPEAKTKRYGDGGGLFLQIEPSGSMRWVFRIYSAGKETMTSFGTYPEVSLSQAREKAAEGRALKRQGINPVDHKRDERARAEHDSITFEIAARQLFESKRGRCTDSYVKDLTRSMELHVFDRWGQKQIASITPRDAITLTNEIQKSGKYIAHKMLARLAEVFEYAVSLGHLQYSPVNRATHKSLKPHDRENMRSIEFDELPELLRRFNDYRGYKITKLSFRFLLLTFIRTGELRQLRWNWLDSEKNEIRIPAAAMKARRDHVVPLSRQSIDVLEQARLLTGKHDLIFPTHSDFDKEASENTILTILYSIGYKGRMTGHGFRSLARSKLAEEGFGRDALELQLAHSISKDATEAAYNRATHIDERKRMMQRWADLVDAADN